MAMLAKKQRPPPGGGVKRVTKPNGNKKPLAQAMAPVISMQQAVKQLPVYAHGRSYRDEPPFDPPYAASSGSNGGGGGSKNWLPTWNYHYGKDTWEGIPMMQALANLCCNARIFTPMGKRFMPDPKHDGVSLTCPPQRPGPVCRVKWNNVVDFETALKDARAEAISRTANSQQSRGGSFGDEQITRPDPELNTRTKGWGWSALRQRKAANQDQQPSLPPSPVETHMREWLATKDQSSDRPYQHEEAVLDDERISAVATEGGLKLTAYPSCSKRFIPWSSSRYGEFADYITTLNDAEKDWLPPWDIDDEPWVAETFNSGVSPSDASDMASNRMLALQNIAITAAMELYDHGYYRLSPCSYAYTKGEEVWVDWHDPESPDEYTRTARMKEIDFLYTMEQASCYFSPSDNVLIEEDSMLSDYAVDQLFYPSDIGSEFNTWTYGELLRLWYEQDHKHLQFQGTCPLNASYDQGEPCQLEIMKWEREYRRVHQSCWLPHARMDRRLVPEHTTRRTMLYPRSTPVPQQNSRGSVSHVDRDDTSKWLSYWVRGDDLIQYQRWLMDNADPEEHGVVERSGSQYAARLRHTLSFLDSVPVHEQIVLPKRQSVIGKAVGKLRSWGRSLMSWMNEPVLYRDYGAKDVAPLDLEEFNHKVDQAVVKKITQQILRDKVAHDDSYDVVWLENLTGKPVNRNYDHDPISMAINAVAQDVPEDEFSESGIYLGKKVVIPRSKEGLILLGDTDGIDSTNRISSSTLDLSKVEDLGKDRLDVPIKA